MFPISFLSLEQRIRHLLTLPPHALSETAADQCSEVARLGAQWILEEDPSMQVFIMKGVGIFGDGERSHELIMVQQRLLITLIDPTIWQFFPDAQHIVLVDKTDKDAASILLTDMYGGTWQTVEEVVYDLQEKLLLESMIERNLKEYFA